MMFAKNRLLRKINNYKNKKKLNQNKNLLNW